MRFWPQAPNAAYLLPSEIMAEKRTNDIAARASESIRSSSMSSNNVAGQAGGEWKWAWSQTRRNVYIYNTGRKNKVFWLPELKDAYEAYVTCKAAIDETVGEEPAVSAEGYIKRRKRRRHLEESESEPKMPRLCHRCAKEEYRYVYNVVGTR